MRLASLYRCYATGARNFAGSVNTDIWAKEIESVKVHATLLNQTSLPGLLNLADVRPMMRVYSQLQSKGVDYAVVRPVCRALNRTMRDSSVTMRRMLKMQRERAKAALFSEIKQACDIVASGSSKTLTNDVRTAGYLLSTYETVGPETGVEVFMSLRNPRLAASGIMCMIAAHRPLEEIEKVFLSAPAPPDPRRTANMILAFLKYGEPIKAEGLAKTLNAETPESVHKFVEEAFIGDAPVAFARPHFAQWDLAGTPHPAAMRRFLDRIGNDSTAQIELFRQYLSLLSGRASSEHDILQVTRAVVANVLSAYLNPHEALPSIQQLSSLYAATESQHHLFLNVLLTSVADRWPSAVATELVQTILAAYGGSPRSPATIRVQLNALEFYPDKESLITELWTERTALGAVGKFDWFSLLRATRGSDLFFTYWDEFERPFASDLTRYAASRDIQLSIA